MSDEHEIPEIVAESVEENSTTLELREMFNHLQEHIDLYMAAGCPADKFRKQISKNREQITTPVRNKGGKLHPMPPEIHAQFLESSPTQYEITRFLLAHQDDGHEFVEKYAQLTRDRLNYVNGDNYGPTIAQHRDYGMALCIGNIKEWVDQYGYNVFDTPRKRVADVVLEQYKRQHNGRPLYEAECRKSDPVVNAPPPREKERQT